MYQTNLIFKGPKGDPRQDRKMKGSSFQRVVRGGHLVVGEEINYYFH
jgi:hypothetical protein